MIFVQVVLGLTWFCAGILGPIASCVKDRKIDLEDVLMMPIAGLMAPISLICFLIGYYGARHAAPVK